MDPAIREAVVDQARRDPAAAGLPIGARAPDFTLSNADGEPVSLSAALERGPVVLKFYRGAWCPICNRDLREFQVAIDRITSLGASMIAVSPQSPDGARKMVDLGDLGYEVLSDPDQGAIRAYRLQFKPPVVYLEYRDLTVENGDGSVTLPVPATYVIDGHGIIRGRHVDPDYTIRMGVQEVVDVLASLA